MLLLCCVDSSSLAHPLPPFARTTSFSQELFAPGGLNFNGYMSRILSGVYDQNVGAAVSIGLKDVAMMRAQADSTSCPLPIADIHHAHLREAAAKGHCDWDWTAVAGVLAEHGGVELGKKD